MNTQKGIAPGTTAGAGALAPAPIRLTACDSDVTIFLRRANNVGRALEFFEELKACTTGENWDHYFEAAVALRRDWKELVLDVRESGGLLHLGRVY